MEELQILAEGQVLVTSARVVINGQTFATRNIGSVRLKDGGTPWAALLFAFLAVALCIAEGTRPFGLAILGTAAYFIVQRARTVQLVLVTGGGEVTALATTQRAHAARVATAIADAISTR